jgi:hypothetical protein
MCRMHTAFFESALEAHWPFSIQHSPSINMAVVERDCCQRIQLRHF